MNYPLHCIHPQAQLGKNVQVGPFTVIEEDVVIGEGTWIGPHVTIMSGARIGSHCQVFPGAVIAAVPQDLKFQGEQTVVEIGNHTVIREFVTIHRGTADHYKTVIGAHVLLMAYVHIAHDCFVGNHCILANAVQLAGHVQLADYVRFGGGSGVHQFVQIGAYVMIAGGSTLRKDIPPFIKVGREPSKYCGLNIVGLRRHGFTNEQIQRIQHIYRCIYQKGLLMTDALEHIAREVPPSQEKSTILHFIQHSKQGIVR